MNINTPLVPAIAQQLTANLQHGILAIWGKLYCSQTPATNLNSHKLSCGQTQVSNVRRKNCFPFCVNTPLHTETTHKRCSLWLASLKSFSMETSGACQCVSRRSGLWVNGTAFLQHCRATPLFIVHDKMF